MIRTVAIAALAFAAALPALAFERSTAPAPKPGDDRLAGFTSVGQVMRLAPAGASDTSRLFSEAQPRGDMVIYQMPKDGKAPSHFDVNDPRDNPFMAPLDRKPASGR